MRAASRRWNAETKPEDTIGTSVRPLSGRSGCFTREYGFRSRRHRPATLSVQRRAPKRGLATSHVGGERVMPADVQTDRGGDLVRVNLPDFVGMLFGSAVQAVSGHPLTFERQRVPGRHPQIY